jgi:hypothetical protein
MLSGPFQSPTTNKSSIGIGLAMKLCSTQVLHEVLHERFQRRPVAFDAGRAGIAAEHVDPQTSHSLWNYFARVRLLSRRESSAAQPLHARRNETA